MRGGKAAAAINVAPARQPRPQQQHEIAPHISTASSAASKRARGNHSPAAAASSAAAIGERGGSGSLAARSPVSPCIARAAPRRIPKLVQRRGEQQQRGEGRELRDRDLRHQQCQETVPFICLADRQIIM
jgi:hypothetical protein